MKKTATIGHDKPYQPDSIDYTRVEERASQGYFREYWSAYKGRVRGMLSGVTIGTAAGGVVGVAVGLAVSVVSGGIAPVALAAFAGAGGLMGADMYGAAGSAAASRAAGLAEKHARMIDPVHGGNELSALNDKLMMDGRGHNFQFPVDRDKGKLFNWKSGLLGAGIGAAVGALLFATPILAFMTVPLGLTVAGTAVATGALGLTFGIDRSNLKAIFNQVDANSEGKIYHGKELDIGRQQFGVIETDKQISEHRMRRQESTFALEEEYHNKIFSASVKGMFKGFAGGATAGSLIGGAIGLVALAAAAVVGIASITAVPMLTVATFAGAGAMYGMKVFADAGREAGAESTARAIDNEFERNQQLRERGLSIPAPKQAPEHLINMKAALLMGAIGMAVGVGMPLLGAAAAHLATGAVVTAMSGMAMAASATVGGIFGAMYGVTRDSVDKVSKATDYLYEKSYVVHNDPASQPYVAKTQTQPALKPEQSQSLQASITRDDMVKINDRIAERAKTNFETTLLSQTNQTATTSI